MPTQNDHETQWDSNHRILEHLKKQNNFPDWVATIAFYTALHSLERFLARRNKHPDGHLERKTILLGYEPQLTRQILRDYLDMYNQSITSRYECIRPTASDIQEQLLRLNRIDAKVGPMV